MLCTKCKTESSSGKKFCAECGSPLSIRCSQCDSDNPPGAKFCADCGTALGKDLAPVRSKPSAAQTTGNIRIAPELRSSEAIDGERKTVTVLFADIKGSMELIEDLDPEEARVIVDPALKLMMDAVHRYEGYVAQSTGTASSPFSVRPWRARIIPSARSTLRCACRTTSGVIQTAFVRMAACQSRFG